MSPALRIGAYARVSSSNQVMENDSSVDTQLHRIRSAADYHTRDSEHRTDGRAWQVVAEYREEGKSGKNVDRPELQRLLADVRDGKLDQVVVTKIDRITRSLIDFYVLWKAFEDHDVQFLALDDNFETSTSLGRAMLKITLIFAELERERTSERIKEKIQHRRREGLWFGGRVPLGYLPHPTNKTTLVPDLKWMQIVREHFFEKLLQLGSSRKVVQHLAREGIKRPEGLTKLGKRHGGGEFGTQTVLNLLQNPVYLGKRREADGTLRACNWPAIIDDGLFAQVQDRLRANREVRPSARPSTGHVFILEGLVRCGSCGSVMTHASGSGRQRAYYYYRCSKKHHSAGESCRTGDVPAQALERFVLEQLAAYAIDTDAIERAVREANAGRDHRLTRTDTDLDAKRGHAAKIQNSINNILKFIEEGVTDFKAVAERLRTNQFEAEKLKAEISSLELARKQIEQESLNALSVAQGYRALPRLFEEARSAGALDELKALLQTVIDVIEWRPSPNDPKAGEAQIQLFDLPETFWKDERPNEAALLGGSLSRPDQLPDQDSNLGHGD